MLKRLLAYTQYILPQHLLTWIFGKLAECRVPWIKNYLISLFIKRYQIDMNLAAIENPKDYPTFNCFFIRKLKPQLRPIASGQLDMACPADGTLSQIGSIHQNQLLQAKQFYFDLETLLGGDKKLAEYFYDGSFATIYLAPHDYHRVHMPIKGRLIKTIYVPGKLFSVNQMTSQIVPHLYSRNERLVSIFETAAGQMAVILVGALIVGHIQTVWMHHPLRQNKIVTKNFPNGMELDKGDELGYFNLGSTVILLFGKDKIEWASSLHSHSITQFGQLLGNIL